jgi:hypothetical protein
VPSLWFFEVGNILEMKPPNLASDLLQVLTGDGFDEELPDTFYEKSFELMKAYKSHFL